MVFARPLWEAALTQPSGSPYAALTPPSPALRCKRCPKPWRSLNNSTSAATFHPVDFTRWRVTQNPLVPHMDLALVPYDVDEFAIVLLDEGGHSLKHSKSP